jgi:hypothetical protein
MLDRNQIPPAIDYRTIMQEKNECNKKKFSRPLGGYAGGST